MTCMKWPAAAGGGTGRPRPPGPGAPGTVTYGLALQAWCVYLMAAHAIPVHRCAELIEALTGAEPSPGFVHSMISRAAAAVADANRATRCLIILAHVISADETPIRVGPGPKSRKKYLLVACTRLLTYYFLGDRSLKTFAAFVLPDMDGAVIVHDRYRNYDAIPGLIHQLCCQHLLRDLADVAQQYPDAHWPAQIIQALQGLIHAANTARARGLAAVPADLAAPMIHAFKHGVLVGLSQVPKVPGRKQRPGRDLLECLRDRQGDVLRFTTDLRIPPTSNQAVMRSLDCLMSQDQQHRVTRCLTDQISQHQAEPEEAATKTRPETTDADRITSRHETRSRGDIKAERDLRPAKTQQKISGRLRSEQATRDRYAIRGYISTVAKHGAHVLTAIHHALAGNPWMPPIPDPP
jgi:transposase